MIQYKTIPLMAHRFTGEDSVPALPLSPAHSQPDLAQPDLVL
jgi:hypothetical protein